MSDLNAYVRVDEQGVMRVGQTRVMLDSLLAAFEQGHSPESIRSQYSSLNLEEVYGAITYSLAHADEVASYLARQDSVWKQERAKAEQTRSPVVERLRASRGANAAEAR